MVTAGLCVMAYRKAEASKIARRSTGLLMAVAIGVWLFDEQPGLPLLPEVPVHHTAAGRHGPQQAQTQAEPAL